MTQEEILEGNKLIAEFMGLKSSETFVFDGEKVPNMQKVNCWLEPPTDEQLKSNNYYQLADGSYYKGNVIIGSDINYNSSWNLLMPVVEKASAKKLPIYLYFRQFEDGNTTIEIPPIMVIYKALVKFIKIYNY